MPPTPPIPTTTTTVAAGDIAHDVRDFLERHIDSLATLETLLLLVQHPSRFWSPQDLSWELGSDVVTAKRALAELKERGFASQAGTAPVFRLTPPNTEQHRVYASVAHAFATQRHGVLDLVASRSMQRLRVLAAAFTRDDTNQR